MLWYVFGSHHVPRPRTGPSCPSSRVASPEAGGVLRLQPRARRSAAARALRPLPYALAVTDWRQRAAGPRRGRSARRASATRFVQDDAPRIYLDGNSLGRMPVATAARIEGVRRRVVERARRRLARLDRRARRAPATCWPRPCSARGRARCSRATRRRSTSTSSCARRSRRARPARHRHRPRQLPDRSLRARGPRRGGGPSCACSTATRSTGRSRRDRGGLRGGDVALVVLSHVAYRSGALADLRAITGPRTRRRARPVGSSHSAGAVPVDLEASGADLAVGCTYKYLNAGPGAPAYLYVRGELQESLRSPIQGWFGQRDQFAMERPYEPDAGRRAASSPARRRSSASPRSTSEPSSSARPASRRSGRRRLADRARRRLPRRRARAARLRARHARATPTGAARTSRSATRTRGASAVR